MCSFNLLSANSYTLQTYISCFCKHSLALTVENSCHNREHRKSKYHPAENIFPFHIFALPFGNIWIMNDYQEQNYDFSIFYAAHLSRIIFISIIEKSRDKILPITTEYCGHCLTRTFRNFIIFISLMRGNKP